MTKNLADELQRTARQALAGLHPVSQGEEPGGLSLFKLLAAVFRSRYLLFGTTLLGLLVGVFLATTTANSYVSTGKFRFTGSGAEFTDIDPTRATQTSQEAIGTTATYILSSPGLLSRVVQRITPERILAPYRPGSSGDSWLASFFFSIQRDWNAVRDDELTAEEALKRLQKTLLIERPRYTDVLVATCTANDPNLAREILLAYMAEARPWHIETYDDPKAYEELRKAVDDTGTRRDTAQRAMKDFRERKAGVQDFEAELRRLTASEGVARAEQRRLASELSVKKAQSAALLEQLDPDKGSLSQYKLDKRKPDPSREIEEYLKRKVELQLELNRLVGLGARDTSEQGRQIKAIDETIESVKRKAAEAEPITELVENPAWRQGRERLAALQSEFGLIAVQLEQGAHSQELERQRLTALLDLEPDYLKLRDELSNAEDALKESQEAWRVANQKRALSQGLFSSLKEIEPASMPLDKESPNRSRLILGGLLVGLFLGLAVIVLRSLPDTIVRTREDLEGVDGLPVIGVVPRMDSRNLTRHRLLREKGW